MKTKSLAAITLLAFASLAAAANEPTSKPAPITIKASDKDALAANQGKDVTVEGTVSDAAWSASGKVMQIHFAGAEDSGFAAVLFQRNKDTFDKAFDGDTTKTLTGAKVKVTGKLATYRDKPQIVLTKPSQLTIDKSDAKPADAKPAATADKP